MIAWTDYPIIELGDTAGVEAPIRQCEVLSYDRNKYCLVWVAGVEVEIKAGYLYREAGRCGETPRLTPTQLLSLPENHSVRVAQ
jgi:hypothetical protein